MKKRELFTLFFYSVFLINKAFAQSENTSTLHAFSMSDLNHDIISATKTEEKVNDAPATVYVVTEEEIIKNGYYTLHDVLANVPGITAINLDFITVGGQRGLVGNFSQTLLMINGREIQNLLTLETMISYQFSTNNIKQIEIVQGPASAIYGANALSGVINIITKSEVSEEDFIEIHLEGGTQNTRSFSVVTAQKSGKLRVGGSYRLYKSDQWDFSGFVQDTVLFSQGFTTRQRGIIDPDHGLIYRNRVEAHTYSGKVSLGSFYAGLEGYYLETGKGLENISLDYKNQRDIRNMQLYYGGFKLEVAKGELSGEYQYYNEHLFGRQFNYNRTRDSLYLDSTLTSREPISKSDIYRYFMDVGSQENSIGSQRHKVNIQYYHSYILGVNVHMGYVFDLNDPVGLSIDSVDFSPVFNDTRNDDNPQRRSGYRYFKHGLYLQGKKSLWENKLFITLGGRYDWHSSFGGVFSLRSGFVYKPQYGTYIKALFGQGFREPSIFERGMFAEKEKLKIDNLDPVRLSSYEVSITQTLGRSFQGMVCTYLTSVTNQIVPRSDEDAIDKDRWRFENSGGRDLFVGVESKLMYRYSHFHSDLIYTFTQTESRRVGEFEVVNLNIYPHRVSAGINYDFGKYLSCNLRSNYFSGITAYHGNNAPEYADSLNTIKPFSTYNFTAAIRNIKLDKGAVEINFTIFNILNTTYYHPNIRKSGARQYLQPGRTIKANLIFKF